MSKADGDAANRSYSGLTRVLVYATCAAFIVLCGVCFHYIESPTEEAMRSNYQLQLEEFLEKHSCVDEENLTDLINLILKTSSKTNAEFDESSDWIPRWDIINSIFFCTTIVTTVGYGTSPPSTVGGRMLAIVCALLGVPMFMTCMAQAGSKINRYLHDFKEKVANLTKRPQLIKFIGPAIIILFGFVLFMLLPSILFCYAENWTFGEALYYCIVTLLTIGFGDYVPNLSGSAGQYYLLRRAVYLLFVCFWMVVGLTWMATIISSIQSAVSNTSEKLDTKLVELIVTHSDRFLADEEDDQQVSTSEINTESFTLKDALRFRRSTSVLQGYAAEKQPLKTTHQTS